MRVRVEIRVEAGGERPPAGAPVVVEVRDVTLQDTAAVVLGRGVGAVEPAGAPLVAAVTVDYVPRGGDLRAWAHVDVDRDGAVSAPDWVSMAAYPVGADAGVVRVDVRPVTPASR